VRRSQNLKSHRILLSTPQNSIRIAGQIAPKARHQRAARHSSPHQTVSSARTLDFKGNTAVFFQVFSQFFASFCSLFRDNSPFVTAILALCYNQITAPCNTPLPSSLTKN
jgi:hypothetical protein